jgi:hypothetical protein
VYAQVESAEQGFAERQIREMSKCKSSNCEPNGQQRKAPAALTEKKFEADPEKSAHEVPGVGMLGGEEAQVNEKKLSKRDVRRSPEECWRIRTIRKKVGRRNIWCK